MKSLKETKILFRLYQSYMTFFGYKRYIFYPLLKANPVRIYQPLNTFLRPNHLGVLDIYSLYSSPKTSRHIFSSLNALDKFKIPTANDKPDITYDLEAKPAPIKMKSEDT